MPTTIEFAKLVRCADFSGADAEEDALLTEMVERAHSYLSSFDWCREIRQCYIGDIAVGGVVAVLLFEIEPSRPDVDVWLWVIVGDLPPAYLVTDNAPNPAAALGAYLGQMERWVEAVRTGEPIDDLIPVETAGGAAPLEPTQERADDLERRLRFLREEIV